MSGSEEDAGARARDDALNLLSYRSRSVAEMRRRLRRKGHEATAIDEAVDWLLERGYLDDEAFAREFLMERLRRKPRGPFALVQELRKRGVARSLAESMVEAVMDEEEVDETSLARSAAESWLARQAPGTRDLLRDGEPRNDAEAARRRLYGYLERRGFGRGTTRRVMDAVVEDPGPDEA